MTRLTSGEELEALHQRVSEECERYGLPTDQEPVRMFELLLQHLDGNHAAVISTLQWQIKRRDGSRA